MMTDIEGSTTLVNQLGKDYGKLIREIRTIIRKVVASQVGHVVDVKADEAFAVFKRPSDAVAGAVGIQREIGERPSIRAHEVRVRIGLHSGKPTVSDGNYIGIAVHTAARICSAAHGGQIVLSGQTREAVKDPTLDGLGFRSLGSHRLRGLPEPLALYQVKCGRSGRQVPAR